jgi:hypothetical protein
MKNRCKGASDEAIQASNQETRGAFVIYKPDNLHNTSIQHTAASAGAGNEFPKMLVNNGVKCEYCSRQTFNVEKQLLKTKTLLRTFRTTVKSAPQFQKVQVD